MRMREKNPLINRRYSDLIRIDSFDGRFEYLKLNGQIGEELFGYMRYLNQVFYQSAAWRKVRRQVIIRDNGCDLGIPGYDIQGDIYVHHINPITLQQLQNNDPVILDPEYLISCSRKTHEAITLGDPNLLPKGLVVRRPNDMCPWKD